MYKKGKATNEKSCLNESIGDIERDLYKENQALLAQIQLLEEEIQELLADRESVTRSYHDILHSRWWRLTGTGRRSMTWLKQKYGHTLPVRAIYWLLDHCMRTDTLPIMEQEPAATDHAVSVKQKIYLEEKMKQLLEDSDTAKVLMISHEMSLTGAPLVFFYMAAQIKKLGYEPVIVSPKDGPLTQEVIQSEIPVIINERILTGSGILEMSKDYSLVIANTLECANIIHSLNHTDTSVVWWIHESAASYEGVEGRGLLMDHSLGENIRIYSVCDYARDLLVKKRPLYRSDILNYYMPDYRNAERADAFSLSEHEGKKVFTLIGTMEPRKGHDILAQAIRLLPCAILEQCYFVIVAKPCVPDVERHIMKVCREYPQNIKHYPFLNRKKIACLHHQTDCLLCTSRDDPLPCVITEALCLGKPVICTENTGYAAILREMDSGLIYENNDPKLLAQCIETFITDSKLAEKISANARATYEKYFSNEVFARHIEQMLERCLTDTDEESQPSL